MKIERITFSVGIVGDAYRTVENGMVQAYYDLAGVPLVMPKSVSYVVSDASPQAPAWFTPTTDPVLPASLGYLPYSVTRMQMRNALKSLGRLAAMKTAINAANVDIQDGWNFGLDVKRDDALVLMLQQTFGWTDLQIDNAFRLAATL